MVTNWAAALLTGLALIQEPYTLKLDVHVVSVDVTVLDQKDNLVNRLTKEDFVVYENGVPQEIRFFSPVSTPQSVFLLFDSSGSTRDNRDFMRIAVTNLIEHLRPQDQLAIASFDDEFQLHLNWSTDRAKALTALEEVVRPHDSNETHFYAALDRTLRREFNGVVGRRSIVVLTDGQDTPFLYESQGDLWKSGRRRVATRSTVAGQLSGQNDLKRVLQSSRELHIPVHIIALKSGPESQWTLPGTISYLNAVEMNMQYIVDNSGGEILFAKDLDEIAPFYEQIGRRLGTSYSLGYVPSSPESDGSFRKIEVKTRNSAFRLTQTPVGYYAVARAK